MNLDFDHVRDQILTSQVVPFLENLLTRLLRVSSPKVNNNSTEPVETSAMVSNRGGRGRGNRGGRGGRPQCSNCKRMGHTQETCYFLHGFLEKSANVSKIEVSNSKFSNDEYEEYLQLKAVQQSQTPTATGVQNSRVCISQSSNNPTSWIINSGASDHIAGTWYGKDDWHRT
ncbi:hypothetical protein CDL12_08520 [Handroanthus impetiginosus]|uniref:Uncharacterized protein n=1 Tax=Handroanthus impetiginosus TaxID=429701 RepID=A0A2G9HMP9_9LAMI|nr:hypothetical protein CDL12_08520 [Handroanthus impetiginosus]